MGIMALTGLMLGTTSYETMQDYHTSTPNPWPASTHFNDALDEWETVLEDYVVNSTEIARQACLDAWDEGGDAAGYGGYGGGGGISAGGGESLRRIRPH